MIRIPPDGATAAVTVAGLASSAVDATDATDATDVKDVTVAMAVMVGLSLGDVDLGDALVRVLGKGSKERVIPLGRLARASLVDWLDTGGRPAMAPARWARRGDEEAVFLNQRGGRLTRQGAWGIVQGHGRRAAAVNTFQGIRGAPGGRLTSGVLQVVGDLHARAMTDRA